MLRGLISYFVRRHLLANFIIFGVLLGGIYFWNTTNKEEMPNVTFDTLRVSVSYPGASAREVEYFVTRPLEDALKD